MAVYLDETREALGGLLRPGNAGSNTADDHVAVLDRALAQIPAEHARRSDQTLAVGATQPRRRDRAAVAPDCSFSVAGIPPPAPASPRIRAPAPT